MALRTEPGADSLDEVRRFYDALAPDYDLMTSFDARFAKERPWFQAIVDRFGMKSALDAGCGTGFHSILLSQLGLSVTGVDTSSAMVDLASKNARRLGVSISTLQESFSGISGIAPGPFDAVFCLGNSLVHLLTDDDLLAALRNFFAVLRPGGVFLLQVLNYERILARRDELPGRREAGGVAFERRYAYGTGTIPFSISKSGTGESAGSGGIVPGTARGKEPGRGQPEQSGSVTLRPMTRELLTAACARAGFADAGSFGDLAMGMFDPAVSPDLVILARRPDLP
ncbi:MAG TPA: class I SAM-dependent methyltransferase [Bacteroidota bacterium]|nr:class I SAM-dependent methyltransferase [Bacteroidota bacterium]